MSRKENDPRVIRTRKLLRESLLALIRSKGFDSISVQDITDHATLNRATFYLHYADKHDLMQNVVRDTLLELTRLPTPVSPSRPGVAEPDRLMIFFTSVFQHVAEHADFYRIMLVEGSVAAFAVQMQDYIEQYGLRWFARVQTDQFLIQPTVIMSSLSGAYIGIVKWWLRNDMPNPPEQIAEQFMRLTLPGILAAVRQEDRVPD
ncbi:MAG: TetR/AcrR family transcriptional regulator [Anaerolineae bacterium]|nr:TetR/AcrR family transcriptional regulator [Anaerolineae bacterium]